MNSFAWLHVLCWCTLVFGFVSSTAIYQTPGGDGRVGNSRREKPLFKTPRVSWNQIKKSFANPKFLILFCFTLFDIGVVWIGTWFGSPLATNATYEDKYTPSDVLESQR